MMHLLTPAPRRWPDPRSSGVGLYIDDPHGLIHDPVASAFIYTDDPHGLCESARLRGVGLLAGTTIRYQYFSDRNYSSTRIQFYLSRTHICRSSRCSFSAGFPDLTSLCTVKNEDAYPLAARLGRSRLD